MNERTICKTSPSIKTTSDSVTTSGDLVRYTARMKRKKACPLIRVVDESRPILFLCVFLLLSGGEEKQTGDGREGRDGGRSGPVGSSPWKSAMWGCRFSSPRLSPALAVVFARTINLLEIINDSN